MQTEYKLHNVYFQVQNSPRPYLGFQIQSLPCSYLYFKVQDSPRL